MRWRRCSPGIPKIEPERMSWENDIKLQLERIANALETLVSQFDGGIHIPEADYEPLMMNGGSIGYPAVVPTQAIIPTEHIAPALPELEGEVRLPDGRLVSEEEAREFFTNLIKQNAPPPPQSLGMSPALRDAQAILGSRPGTSPEAGR